MAATCHTGVRCLTAPPVTNSGRLRQRRVLTSARATSTTFRPAPPGARSRHRFGDDDGVEGEGVRVVAQRIKSCLAATVGLGEQGLTLVHFSAQRKRFLLDRGCI